MNPRQISFSSESRDKLKAGVDALANAVKVTLGPKGRNVVLGRANHYAITKDGVSVAREVFLTDPVENLGAQMVKQVSSNVASAAGDGTTTATVLAQSILSKGIKMIEAGFDPMDLKSGIDKTLEDIKADLVKNKIEVAGTEQIMQVATISANGDRTIGSIIAKAMDEVGFDGVITIDNSPTHETYLELMSGMQFEGGYLSPYFINNLAKLESQLENPIVFIYDGKIKGLKGLIHVLESANTKKRPLLIIASGMEGDALQALVMNKANGILDVCAVNAPGHGKLKSDILKDIAAVLGANVLSELHGHDIANLNPSMIDNIVGGAEKVIVSEGNTVIINGSGNSESINERIEEIKSQIENQENESEILILKERLSKLEGGIAMLKIGAYTDVELKEKRDRVDDALSATKAAVEEGILPGGGIALYRASLTIGKNGFPNLNDTEKIGAEILLSACQEPFNVIIENTGKNAEVIAKDLTDEYTNGYDSRNGKYVDMIQEGIIDPAKVTRSAIENAASVSGLMITTECVLIEKPTDKEA